MMWKAAYLRNLSEALRVEQYVPFPRAPSVFLKNLMEALETLARKGFDPNQPRDEDGKWTAAGSGSAKGQEGVDKASQRKNKEYVAKANEWLGNYQKARSSYEISSYVANADLDNFLEFVGISKDGYTRTHDLLEKHTREHTQEDADAALEKHWSNQDEVVGVLHALDVLERGQFEFERLVEIGRFQEKIDTLDTKWAPDRIFPDGKNLHPDFGNREKGMPSSYDITSAFDSTRTSSGDWDLTQGDPNAGYESYVVDFNKRRADLVEQRGRAEEAGKYIYRKVRASGEPLVQSWTTSSSGANTQGGEEGWNIVPNAKMDLSTNRDVLVVSGFARYRGYQSENEVIVIDPSRAPRATKYTRRWKGPNGEWQYEYPDELLKNIEDAFHILYDPNQPRDEAGRWTSRGASAYSASYDKENKRWLDAKGNSFSENIQKRLRDAKVGAHLTDVKVNPSQDEGLVAVGWDSKNRMQGFYTPEHRAGMDAEKFRRIAKIDPLMDGIRNSLRGTMNDESAGTRQRDTAACLYLITKTGMRPGSTTDTKADYEAFGASTLQGRHLKSIRGDAVSFEFVGGKAKGKAQKQSIIDSDFARYVANNRKKGTSPLFQTNDGALRDAFKGLGAEEFKVKDIRTWVATDIAIKQVGRMKKPKTQKEYRAAVKQVSEVVSQRLGNTPVIALKSYIAPSVFTEWQAAVMGEV